MFVELLDPNPQPRPVFVGPVGGMFALCVAAVHPRILKVTKSLVNHVCLDQIPVNSMKVNEEVNIVMIYF